MGDNSSSRRKHKPIRPPTPDASEELQEKRQNRQNSMERRKASVFQRLGAGQQQGQQQMRNKKPVQKRDEVCRNFLRTGTCNYGFNCVYVHTKPQKDFPQTSERQPGGPFPRRYPDQSGPAQSKAFPKRGLDPLRNEERRGIKRQRDDAFGEDEFDDQLRLEQRRLEIQKQLAQLENDEDRNPQQKKPPPTGPPPRRVSKRNDSASSNGEVGESSDSGEASSSGSSSSSSDDDSDSDDQDVPPKKSIAKKGREEGEAEPKRGKLQSPIDRGSRDSITPRKTSKPVHSVVTSAVIRPQEPRRGEPRSPPAAYKDRYPEREPAPRYPEDRDRFAEPRDSRRARGPPDDRDRDPRAPRDRDLHPDSIPSILDLNVPTPKKGSKSREGRDGGKREPLPPASYDRRDEEPRRGERDARGPPPPRGYPPERVPYDDRRDRIPPPENYRDGRQPPIDHLPPLRDEGRERYREPPFRGDDRDRQWNRGRDLPQERRLPPPIVERDPPRYRDPEFIRSDPLRRTSVERHQEYMRLQDDRTEVPPPEAYYPEDGLERDYGTRRLPPRDMPDPTRGRYPQRQDDIRDRRDDHRRADIPTRDFPLDDRRGLPLRQRGPTLDRPPQGFPEDRDRLPPRRLDESPRRLPEDRISISRSRDGGSRSPRRKPPRLYGPEEPRGSPSKGSTRSSSRDIRTPRKERTVRTPARARKERTERLNRSLSRSDNSGSLRKEGKRERMSNEKKPRQRSPSSVQAESEGTPRENKDISSDELSSPAHRSGAKVEPPQDTETKSKSVELSDSVPTNKKRSSLTGSEEKASRRSGGSSRPVVSAQEQEEEDEKLAEEVSRKVEEAKKAELSRTEGVRDELGEIIPISGDCLEEISDDELDEEGGIKEDKSEIGADRVDWSSLLAWSKQQKTEEGVSTFRQRFARKNFLRTMPFSKKLLGNDLAGEIENECNKELAEGDQNFKFEHETCWEHMAALSKREARKNLFTNKGTCGAALSARFDLQIRRTLCGLGPDFVEPVNVGETGLAYNPSLYEMAKQQFKESLAAAN